VHLSSTRPALRRREARDRQRVGATTETVYTTVLGVGQHDLYHAGQIAALKRAAESGSDV